MKVSTKQGRIRKIWGIIVTYFWEIFSTKLYETFYFPLQQKEIHFINLKLFVNIYSLGKSN